MNADRKSWMDRAAGAIDLMIDFATLGEYGLEPAAASSAGACEGAGGNTGWEALGRARRGDCLSPAPAGAHT